MPRSPKILYIVLLAIIGVALTGCQLRREEGSGSDAQPISDSAPTLAPLGADSSELTDTAPPTVIIVDPTATPSTLTAGAAVSQEPEPSPGPAVDLSPGGAGENTADQPAVEPESFILPEDEETVEQTTTEASPIEQGVVEEAALEAPVIANAVTDNALPSGGPIAANPPVSATTGDYVDASTTSGSHLVQPGDTLFSISQRYGTTVQAIMLANGLTSELIYDGQVLNIGGYDSGYAAPPANNFAPTAPVGQGTHIVAAGETLFSIAARYGSSVEVIAGANGIPYPYTIYPGQPLAISGLPDYAPNNYQNNGYSQPNVYPPQNENPYYTPDNYAPPGNNTFVNPSGLATHTVAPGETLFSIAQRYGLTAESIAAANGLVNPNQIAAGQVLNLP